MASSPINVAHLLITQARSRLAGHFRTTFYANAYALILNEVTAAGLGVLFWLLAARLYTAEVVGQSSATISTVMFLASVSQLSLRSAMIRFVPRAGTGTGRLVLYTYGICMAAAALISTIFLFAGSSIPLVAILLGDNNVGATWFVLATMAWCIYYVEAGVLTGMRRSLWVLIGNSSFNIAKLCSLVFLFWVSFGDGIVVSWFLPVPIVVLLINALIFWQFMPNHLKATGKSVMPISLRQVVTSVTFDHIGSMLAEATGRVLPLLVLYLLGKGESAYFYQAWLVASVLYLVASSMASSFTVEASANMGRIVAHSKRMLLHTTLMTMPMTALMFVAAPLGLGLFGEVYAREGAGLLRLLALAALPVILNTWYLSYARVLGDFKSIILLQGILCVLTLGLSYWWLPDHGITSIGAAWLIGQAVVAVLVAGKTATTLLNNT